MSIITQVNKQLCAPLDQCCLCVHHGFAAGALASRYGMHRIKIDDKGNKVKRLHAGVDLFAPVGTPCKAMFGGKVMSVHRHKGYGNTILIEAKLPDLTVYIFYAHLSETYVRAGDHPYAGYIIGKTGVDGVPEKDQKMSQPHLHLEVWKTKNKSIAFATGCDNRAKCRIDPMNILKYAGVTS